MLALLVGDESDALPWVLWSTWIEASSTCPVVSTTNCGTTRPDSPISWSTGA